ncbi:hypothetical protein ACFQLX_07035 [Streptomyces polyrhachis]|uniref:Uncharacterized protein n=1 Tax=Streptomyces polyrhachis TaxID=1282885 RepID=A0ABW2GDR7_9ACTN
MLGARQVRPHEPPLPATDQPRPEGHREHADEVVARWSEDWPDHTAEVEQWDRWRWERQGPDGASAVRDRMPERTVVFHARAVFLPGGERAATELPEQWSVPA